MKKSKKKTQIYKQIYNIVRLIPAGKIASYGQIAAMLDCCTPRMVGYAMAALPADSDVAWHRVINSQGRISQRSGGGGELIQRALLEAESISFDQFCRVDFSIVRWTGQSEKKFPNSVED